MTNIIHKTENPEAFANGIALLRQVAGLQPSDITQSLIDTLNAQASFSADDYALVLDSNGNGVLDFDDVFASQCDLFSDINSYLQEYFPELADQYIANGTEFLCDETDLDFLAQWQSDAAIGADATNLTTFCNSIPLSGTVLELFGEFNEENLAKYRLIVAVMPLAETTESFGSLKTGLVLILADGTERTVVFTQRMDALATIPTPIGPTIDEQQHAFLVDLSNTISFDEHAVYDKMCRLIEFMRNSDNIGKIKIGFLLLIMSCVSLAQLGLAVPHLINVYEAEMALKEIYAIYARLQKVTYEREIILNRLQRQKAIIASFEENWRRSPEFRTAEKLAEYTNAKKNFPNKTELKMLAAKSQELQVLTETLCNKLGIEFESISTLLNTNTTLAKLKIRSILLNGLSPSDIEERSIARGVIITLRLVGALATLAFVWQAGEETYHHFKPTRAMQLRNDISLLFDPQTGFAQFQKDLHSDKRLREDIGILWWSLSQSGILAELGIE